MSKSQPMVVYPESLPKVRAFMDAKDRVDAFKAKNYEVFKEFEQLLEEYNRTLEDAEKDVRAREVNCGPFTICGEQTKIDVEKLYDEVGEEDFLKIGGSVSTRRVLEIDKKKFETLAESGLLPKEVVAAVWKRSYKYKAPDKVELP